MLQREAHSTPSQELLEHSGGGRSLTDKEKKPRAEGSNKYRERILNELE